MKNSLYKKVGLFLAIILIAIPIFGAIPRSFAVSVGDSLTQPEPGWQRIDDTDNLFVYSSGWSKRPPQLEPTYNGSYHYTSNTKSSLKFRFYGTKIRYIGQTYSNKPRVVRMNIDGVEETFAQKGPNTYQIVNYEKVDLQLGYHDGYCDS